MQYRKREPDRETAALTAGLEPVVQGLGFALFKLELFRSRRSVRVRLIITVPPDASEKAESGSKVLGTTELAMIHRAVIPRLELALGTDISLELSSPGTDRVIQEGAEFRYFTGRRVQCWENGASAWRTGILRGHDTEKILLEMEEGTEEVRYESIAKARLGV